MSNEVADFTAQDEDVLLNVDRAHKALEKVNDEIGEAVEEATAKINAEYSPICFAAQSVLYEAMSKAASQGFTYRELAEVMQCDGH